MVIALAVKHAFMGSSKEKKKKAFMGAKTGQLSKIIIQISANRPNTTTYT